MDLPTAAEIAKQIPAMIVKAGGSLDLLELREEVERSFLPRILALREDGGGDYLLSTFNDAITIVVQRGLVNTAGTRLLISDKGWEQASVVLAETEKLRRLPQAADDTIDMSNAEPVIEYRQGRICVRGYLREDAGRFHGQRWNASFPMLLDEVYEAEVDGDRVDGGFYSATKANGLLPNVLDLLMRSGIGMPGMHKRVQREHIARSRGRPRRAGWSRIICELIAEAGGHSDWPSIAVAAGKRPESEQDISWREEARQALRNHTVPSGRGYFSVVELADGVSYALTEAGWKLANKRTQDNRAPTLTRYLADAADPHGSGKLTEMELYALLFLATQLGLAREAKTIYHKLPPDFPDEDRYAMIPFWIDQAESRGQQGAE